MSMFQLTSIVIALVALFGYLNHKLIKLPDTIGMTAVGLVAWVAIALSGKFIRVISIRRLRARMIDAPT
jgi:CPA1 family monovalent cation:H+ antiporter